MTAILILAIYLSGVILSLLTMKLANVLCDETLFRRSEVLQTLFSWFCFTGMVIVILLDSDFQEKIMSVRPFKKLGDWIEK